MNYSQQQKIDITKKIVNLVENSKLNIDQDFEILMTVLKKYDFKTIPNLAKLLNKSKAGLYKNVNKDTFPGIKINNVPFGASKLFKIIS